MDGNELIVYNHIKDARNEGIWTKMIKARTNLHQTVMTRCLKLLEQKQLVKAVKSVKFPTRKIYMLYDLTPSIELSGGPWYTDNELDTNFIHELSMACLRYIQSKTWPKDGRSSSLYPASHTAQLPTAAAVHDYLRAAKLTDTELEMEHVVALLDLLIYSNEIEKIPALPGMNAPTRARRRILHGSDNSDDEIEPIQRPSGTSHKRRRVGDGPSSSDDSASEDAIRAEKPRGWQANGAVSDSDGSASDSRPHSRAANKSRRIVDESDDANDTANLTHVPYVYRAVKSMLQPAGTVLPPDCVPLNLGWFQTLQTVPPEEASRDVDLQL